MSITSIYPTFFVLSLNCNFFTTQSNNQSNALLRELELGTVAKTKYVTQKGAIEASSVPETPLQRYSGVATRRETKYSRVKENLPSVPYPESTLADVHNTTRSLRYEITRESRSLIMDVFCVMGSFGVCLFSMMVLH